jgi:hypothetical protein
MRPLLPCPSSTPVPAFALLLPSRLVAMADALLGMVTIGYLLHCTCGFLSK